MVLTGLAQSQVAAPLPGAMEVTLSVTSINNIVGMLAGILPSYMANNKTISLNYT